MTMTLYRWDIKKNQDNTFTWIVNKYLNGVIISVVKQGIEQTYEKAKSEAVGLSWYLNRG
jgi:hypothetical protein